MGVLLSDDMYLYEVIIDTLLLINTLYYFLAMNTMNMIYFRQFLLPKQM